MMKLHFILLIYCIAQFITVRAQTDPSLLTGKWKLSKSEAVNKESSANFESKLSTYQFSGDSSYVCTFINERQFKGQWYYRKPDEIHLVDNAKKKPARYNYDCSDAESILIIIDLSKENLCLKEEGTLYYFTKADN